MNFSKECYKNVMFKLKSSPLPENIRQTSDSEVTTVDLLLLLFEKSKNRTSTIMT